MLSGSATEVQEVPLSELFSTCEEVLMRRPDATLAIRRTAFRWLASSGRSLPIDEAATIARVEVVVREGRPESSSAVGWLPQVGCSNVIEEFCPSALLFCSGEHLETWRTDTQAVDGEAMTVDGLAERGRLGGETSSAEMPIKS